jgi:ribokinase
MSDLTPTLRTLLGRIGPPVAVVGSANGDLTVTTASLPQPGETVVGSEAAVHPGGKSANQAVQAALLGAQVAFVGAVGDDDDGRLLRRCMESAGVDLQHCHTSRRRTGSAIIAVDRVGENFILVAPGANEDVNAALVGRSARALEGARVLGLCFESPLAGVLAAAETAARSGTMVMLNVSPFHEPPRELLEHVAVVIVNEGELGRLLGRPVEQLLEGGDPGRRSVLVESLRERGVRRAIITLGARGSLVVDDDRTFDVPGHQVDVVDTTGCGDAFFGTVLAATAAGASLRDAARLGSIVSSIAATGAGAQSSYVGRRELLAQFETS